MDPFWRYRTGVDTNPDQLLIAIGVVAGVVMHLVAGMVPGVAAAHMALLIFIWAKDMDMGMVVQLPITVITDMMGRFSNHQDVEEGEEEEQPRSSQLID